jgi:hypothetical protein
VVSLFEKVENGTLIHFLLERPILSKLRRLKRFAFDARKPAWNYFELTIYTGIVSDRQNKNAFIRHTSERKKRWSIRSDKGFAFHRCIFICIVQFSW